MLAASLVFLTVLAGPQPGTRLELVFRDDQGRPLTPDKAELLLVAWGDTKKLDLSPEGDKLTVNLDPEWLAERWNRAGDIEKAYLYFQAGTYARICSEPFRWLGSQGGKVEEAEVAIPDAARLSLKRGDHKTAVVKFRPRDDRRIRFIDDKQAPVAGIKVQAFMFWSNSNHCGQWSGIEPLGSATSARSGIAAIEGGDFEYGLKIESAPYAPMENPGKGFYWQLISRLEGKETIIRLKKLQRVRLAMTVTRGGKPAPGESLRGIAAYQEGCGTNFGHLAASDAKGMIEIRDFYPELLSLLYFQNVDPAYEKRSGWMPPNEHQVWSLDPKKVRPGEVIIVDLPRLPNSRK